MIVGTARTGSPSTAAKTSRLTAVRPETMVAGRAPACTSMRYCSAAPTAPPPGAIFDSALPASCEAITGGHVWARMATCCSAHRQASVASCSPAIAPSQPAPNSPRSFQEEKRSSRLGNTRYSETAVIASQMARLTRRLRGVGCASPRSMTCSTSARSSIARSTRSPTRARGATVMGCILHGAQVGAPHPARVIRSLTGPRC